MARPTKKMATQEEFPMNTPVVETKAAVAAPKEYTPTDLIPCRSMVQGELILIGTKSGIPYNWYGVGESVEVEYQDLVALALNRSKYLSEPLFVIDDPDVLAQTRFKDAKKAADALYESQDMDEILNLPPDSLRMLLRSVPKTFQNTLAIEVSTRIEDGSYDSVNRIKIFDEICGTDLMCLIN